MELAGRRAGEQRQAGRGRKDREERKWTEAREKGKERGREEGGDGVLVGAVIRGCADVWT